MQEKTLISKFKKSIPLEILSDKKKPFMVVAFIGLTGVGKTTIAYLLSQNLKLPVFSHDQARVFMEKHGFSSKNRDLVEKMNYERIIYNVRNEVSHIIDGDILSYYEDVKTLIESYGGRLFLINVICPESVLQERLATREKSQKQKMDAKILIKGGWNEYLYRRRIHLNADYPDSFFYTIDTAKDLTSQIKRLVFKIKRQNFLLKI